MKCKNSENDVIFKILKKMRLEKHLTQFEVAELAEIDEKYYGQIERGINCPTLNIFIIKALEINPSELLEMFDIEY